MEHILFITRENLRESSHQLLLKYFVEDSEKNLNLPSNLNSQIIKAIEVDGRDDPDVFNYVKTFFNKLENEHLPKFWTLWPPETSTIPILENYLRILLLIYWVLGEFYNGVSKLSERFTACYNYTLFLGLLFSHFIDISNRPGHGVDGDIRNVFKSNGRLLMKIREKFIYRFIVKRSLWVLFLVLIFTAIFTVLFSLVPGHRL